MQDVYIVIESESEATIFWRNNDVEVRQDQDIIISLENRLLRLLTYLNATLDNEAKLIPSTKPNGLKWPNCEEVQILSYFIICHACPLCRFTYFHKSGHYKYLTFSIQISTAEAIRNRVDMFSSFQQLTNCLYI